MMNTLLYKGELQSIQTYIIDNKKVNQMYYHDIMNKITLEMINVNKLFYYGTFSKFEEESSDRLFFRENICLLDFNEKNDPPIIFNYQNSNNTDEDNFKIIIHNKYFNISLVFDKSKNVIHHKNDNTYTVYGDKDNLEEKYYILEDGIFCINYAENKATFFNNNINIDYNLSIKNKIDRCILLNWLVDKIQISYEDTLEIFYIEYDDEGLIKSCKNINNDEELCNYSYEKDNNLKLVTVTTVYPLLFDSFDFCNNSKFSKLWAMDKLIRNDNFIELERKIYKFED